VSGKLHGSRYFFHLLDSIDNIPESVRLMLRLSRTNLDMITGLQKKLINLLQTDSLIKERVDRLMTIKGIGQVTALTWVLEIEDPNRFSRISKAVSYCGLCSAQKESASKNMRGPISKKRNKHLQWVLIEAAKIVPI
jgi:transposase